MKKNIVLLLLFLINLQTNAQSEFDKISDCYFSSFENGSELIIEIKKFENFLISKKIMKDNSANSYYALFKSTSYESSITDFEYYFQDSIKNIKLEEIEKCKTLNEKLLSDIV